MGLWGPGSRMLLTVAGTAALLVSASPAASAAPAAPDDLATVCASPDQDACDAAQRIVDAIAAGDGATAAKLIQKAGFATNAPLLGDLIFLAGVAATEPGVDGSGFPDGVAVAFVDGGVPIGTASEAFAVAGTKAAIAGLTPERAQLGAAAIAKTYALYAERGIAGGPGPAPQEAALAVF